MSKAAKYGTNLAIAGGLGNGMLNVIKQLKQMDANPDQKFDWPALFWSIGKGALVLGGAGYTIGAIVDHRNSLIEVLNTDAILSTIVNDIRLSKEDKDYIQLNSRADNLIGLFRSHFSSKLMSEPLKGGSSEKGTALRDHFDIDIFLSFKPGSFRSTAIMMEELHQFLQDKKGACSIHSLREQGKSIGAVFLIDGKKFKIDLVPCKITKSHGNKSSGYLHVRNTSVFGDNSSYTKTDVQALNDMKLKPVQQKILLLLKSWKKKNGLPISSHLLHHLLLDAYAYNAAPRSFTEKIVMVLQHIADNLDRAVIRGVENTNNVLTDIPQESKDIVIRACKKVIEDYQYQPNSIIDSLS